MDKKCVLCDEILIEENTQTSENSERCDDCYEEWSDLWPDQV